MAGRSVWAISTEQRTIAFGEVKEGRLCLRCRNKGRSNTLFVGGERWFCDGVSGVEEWRDGSYW